MELLQSLRAIWRRRLPLAAGVLVAAAVLVALGGTNPVTTANAVAWTGVTLDTPQSQLVAVAPLGADTLPWRAALLTHLMATETSTQQLARRLGVGADQVVVVDPALATPLVSTAMAQAAAMAASRNVAPYALTVFVENQSLPVISVEAAAPNRLGAERLAGAAVAILESQASRGGPFTSRIPTGAKVFERQPFAIGQVAPVRVKLLPATALRTTAVGASILIFLVWCAGVLIVPRLSKALRPRRTPLPA
jgi:hypothetical protein